MANIKFSCQVDMMEGIGKILRLGILNNGEIDRLESEEAVELMKNRKAAGIAPKSSSYWALWWC